MSRPRPAAVAWILLPVLACAALAAADPVLPDPLVALDGSRITDPAAWSGRRRGELLEILRREEYGRIAVARPAGMTCTVTREDPQAMGGTAVLKLVRIAWPAGTDKAGMDVVLFVPKQRTAPAPCMLLICNRGRGNIDPSRAHPTGYWPAERLVGRGYAAAAFYNGDIAPDKGDRFTAGALGATAPEPEPRPADAWGALAAWAWGASRAIDYLVGDRDIDAKHLAVVGQSRGGKAALWCGAQDERVALSISNCSGCSGAAASRGKGGQAIAGITKEFPWWFAANYRQWADREWHMPFDQHEVIALCAPRLVYVASASGDWGSDPRAEFRACVAASPVWGLWQKTGLPATAMPPAQQPVQEGSIGYHLRQGEHDLTAWDWDRFMDFADRHWRL